MTKKLQIFFLASLVATATIFADEVTNNQTSVVVDNSNTKANNEKLTLDIKDLEKKDEVLKVKIAKIAADIDFAENRENSVQANRHRTTLNNLEAKQRKIREQIQIKKDTQAQLNEQTKSSTVVNASLLVAAKAFIVAHPVVAGTALTVTTLAAIVAVYKWRKASSEAQELAEELEALEKVYA